uniref:alpha-hydroxy-acid oxidizing protein n=1 Tax=uncultured Jatrophihabitans sp. TaxID=1610747 RepID=UPI0035CB1373
PAFLAQLDVPPEQDLPAAVAKWRPMFTGTDRTWDELAEVRELWSGPILLKGIQHPDDARRAVDAGMQGVVVSNHGGRQIDGAIASLDALPGVVEAVGDQVEVLFDSGVRTGSDVVKALALGARMAVLGRPYVYGLGLGGYDGVRHVLRCLLTDTDLALALSGNHRVADLGPHLLQSR